MKRRHFIKMASTVAPVTLLSPALLAKQAGQRPHLVNTNQLTALEFFPTNQTRHWLGRSLWGNRLQDWRLHQGRIECLRGEKGFEIRTASILSHELNPLDKPARIRMKIGSLIPNAPGFCGFLLGIGAGKLDYRGAALAQRFSGENGGFMAVIDHQGQLSFKDFSNQEAPMAYHSLNRKNLSQTDIKPIHNRSIILDCHIDPVKNNRFDVRLIATDQHTKEELGFIVRTGVSGDELVGGLSLVSSPPAGKEGNRWWFSDIELGGDKLSHHPERMLGPIMGCMYSLNQTVLKLTAQCMPIDLSHNQSLRLDFKPKQSTTWQQGPEGAIENGYVALFRLDNWDSKKPFDYRIAFSGSEEALFTGEITQDPATHKHPEECKIALYSCIIPTAKSLDRGKYEKLIPQEEILGRYTTDNILFPHNKLVSHCDWHQPDLYVFCGDQYYETYPTRYGRDTPDAKLDTLYRWYLWYWTFRDSIRNKPCIMLADDHDVLQGNLWGNAGKDSKDNTEESGGFTWDKSLVRMVYRMQHGHNPDAYDPTPIAHDIPVTYGEFIYGGVSFCLVEDRKFKTPPNTDVPPLQTRGELLGARQEAFLDHWGKTNTHLPKVCLTASIWGSPQTKGDLEPLLDYDSNGYPPDGRTRAVQLLQQANAIALAGDQHLAMVAKQGLTTYEDGALFFAGPAAAAFWQRWFEGEGKLDNRYKNNPNTGNFTDTFGNKMRVLAVANPKITYKEFTESNTSWGNFVADHRLKSEGYGIITINNKARTAKFECWPWQEHPKNGNQFYGWPYVHTFAKNKLS